MALAIPIRRRAYWQWPELGGPGLWNSQHRNIKGGPLLSSISTTVRKNEMDAGGFGRWHPSREYKPGILISFSECLAVEEQMRQHYAEAFEARERGAAAKFERRRQYVRARELQAKRDAIAGGNGTAVAKQAEALVLTGFFMMNNYRFQSRNLMR